MINCQNLTEALCMQADHRSTSTASEATYSITVKLQRMNAGIKHTQIIYYEMLTLLSYVILHNTNQSSHKTLTPSHHCTKQ